MTGGVSGGWRRKKKKEKKRNASLLSTFPSIDTFSSRSKGFFLFFAGDSWQAAKGKIKSFSLERKKKNMKKTVRNGGVD